MASKFRNVRVEIDGLKFDSKGEGNRYLTLKQRLDAGVITDLRTQVTYRLTVNGVKVADYRADFAYRVGETLIVEDFKSRITAKLPTFRMKMKLMKAIHGIDVSVVMKPDA